LDSSRAASWKPTILLYSLFARHATPREASRPGSEILIRGAEAPEEERRMAMDQRRGSRAPIATLLVVLLSAGIVGPSIAEVRVEYRTSRMFGLFMFASTIAGFPNRPGALAEVFRTSPYITSETRALVAEFRDLHRGLLIGIDFNGFPPSRPNGTNLEQLFAGGLSTLRTSTSCVARRGGSSRSLASSAISNSSPPSMRSTSP
jgi:hypothetical protein